MRIVVVGSGAREHALVWKLVQSSRVEKVYATPGNPGIATLAECVPIAVTDIVALAEFAERIHSDLAIVGPEISLALGIGDLFRSRGLRIFGPNATSAQLESSKAFAKDLMIDVGIPTAHYRAFHDYHVALAYLKEHAMPVVVKANGITNGKGTSICRTFAEAQKAVMERMVDRIFDTAGDVLIIEDFLEGDEVSIHAICNGMRYLPLVLSQDHKEVYPGGPNTGGMGAYAPVPFVDKALEMQICQRIIEPTLEAFSEKGIEFSGCLYPNMMLTKHGPVVLEYNTRFGDPETQALMMLMKEDLLAVLEFAEGGYGNPDTLWHPGYAVSLTLASAGYPGRYRTGLPITGIEEVSRLEQIQIFHAGTAIENGQLVTSGGRVLSIVARGVTLDEAMLRVYDAVAQISFEGMHFRKDIAHRALRKL